VHKAFALLLLMLLTTTLAGCADLPVVSAAFDVFNAAETAKTGYDMAVGMGGRKMIEVKHTSDDEAENKLRALLQSQRGVLAQATGNVIGGHAYVVGVYQSPADLVRAKQLAESVSGVRKVTLCLFPLSQSQRAGNSDGEMRDIILRLAGVRTREVRVRVVQGNAVLLGNVKNPAEREKLLASARSAGAVSVQNYLSTTSAS